MIAPLLTNRPTKRQKRPVTPPALFHVEDDEASSLGGVEDHYSCDYKDEEEDHSQDREHEENLLDRVLLIYDQYEEDSLVEQSRLRSKLSPCGHSKIESLKKKLHKEKIKCSLFKVLTLLLQSESRLKGLAHEERMDLMRQVKRVLLDNELYSVGELKSKFTLIFASLGSGMFPPPSVFIPTSHGCSAPSCVQTPHIDQRKLSQETHSLMTRLEQSANKSLQQRLIQGDYQHSKDEGEDWESMHEVWNVWLQFPAKSSEQLAVWRETLQSSEGLGSLLWNLAYYLSIESHCV